VIKISPSQRFVVPAILVVLVIALFSLAILQYRWTTQIGEVTGLRIGTNLKAMMIDWHLDFFRQISDLPITLQVGPDAGAHDTWNVYLQRYSGWSERAVDPNLVKDVYLWETSTAARPRLLRFNLDAAQLQPTQTPATLQNLLARLRDHSANMPAAFQAWTPPSNSGSSITLPPTAPGANVVSTGWQFDQDLPAAVHPIIHHMLPGDTVAARAYAVDWIVVVYNWETIATDLIPRLADRYFGNPEGLQFKVAVVTAVNGTPARMIYSSDPDFGRTTAADAILNIFGPAPQNLESRVWQPTTVRNTGSPTEWQNVSGFLWFPVVQYSGTKETWELRVRHRRDSLAAVIAGVRRRSLLVGLGVLSVLASAIIMLLVASYRAQTLSKLQMQFVASVSHELRTPLAVLSSATENIADGIVQDQRRLEQYRSIMRKQIRQLSELVDHVLMFAATNESRRSYELRTVSIAEVVRSVVDDLIGFIEQNGIEVQCSISDEIPQVRADYSVLSQCLQTLVVNAIKYRGENRWVGIEAKLNTDGNGRQEVQITVRDRGFGIQQSELPHIFKPFYRSPSVTAANIHGSGLGLSLAKSLIEAIGGRITLATEVGKGSAFTLHLAVEGSAQPQAVEPAPMAHS
jgi:two-component system, OmpR family, sensor histidine kinase SenX3